MYQVEVKDTITKEVKIFFIEENVFRTKGILIGSNPDCDVILESKPDSIIFGQHGLLGRFGHHIYLRKANDENGISDKSFEYGTFAKFEDGDQRVDFREFMIGNYDLQLQYKESKQTSQDSVSADSEENEECVDTRIATKEEYQKFVTNFSTSKLNFADLEWREISPSRKFKFFSRDNFILNIQEFTKNSEESADDSWCESQHLGYIISGKAEIDFGYKKIIFQRGDGIFIPKGNKHKISLLSKKLTIFYVDKKEPSVENEKESSHGINLSGSVFNIIRKIETKKIIESLFNGELKDEDIERDATFILAVESNVNPKVIERSLRIASTDVIITVLDYKLLGLQLKFVNPSSINCFEIRDDFQYFKFETSGPFWEGIKGCKKFSIYAGLNLLVKDCIVYVLK